MGYGMIRLFHFTQNKTFERLLEVSHGARQAVWQDDYEKAFKLYVELSRFAAGRYAFL